MNDTSFGDLPIFSVFEYEGNRYYKLPLILSDRDYPCNCVPVSVLDHLVGPGIIVKPL